MRRLTFALTAALSLVAKAAAAATIFLTAGTSWTVPADWNSRANTIEVIGAGGAGGGPSYNTQYYGGGGGAYARIANVPLTPGATVSIHFGTVGCAGVSDGVWFSSAGTLFAESGWPGCNQNAGVGPGTGGRASLSVGTFKFSGGTGALSGGGGGAAGLFGDGAVGAGAIGGTGDNGHGGAGGNGAAGGAGTEYDASHGSGGGGGGGGAAFAGGAYGGGGGTTASAGAAGAGGLIVITYQPNSRISSGAF